MSQARTLDDLDFRPKLILAIEGERGSGKSALGLSAASIRPPLTHMRFDFASQGALRGMKNAGLTKSIILHDYVIDIAKDLEKQAFEAREVARKSKGKPQRDIDAAQKEADIQLASVKGAAKEVYDDFKVDYIRALDRAGTVLIDTGAELYQTVRMSIFGLLRQIPQMNYEKTNKEMLNLINLAEASDSNLVFINRLRDDWAADSEGKRHKTGKMITDGWDGIEYPAHVVVRLYREGMKSDPDRTGPVSETPGAFRALFLKCNDKELDDLTGTSIEILHPLLGFDLIGQAVYGSDWNS